MTTHTVSYNLSVLNADVNVSGKVVINDTWRSLSKIEFVDKQTDLNYTGSLGDSWLEGDSYDNGSRNVFYSVTFQNQHNYTVVCHVDGIFNWGQVFNGGDLSVNAAVGSVSMTNNFSFFNAINLSFMLQFLVNFHECPHVFIVHNLDCFD
jgi:hypothetical protein